MLINKGLSIIFWYIVSWYCIQLVIQQTRISIQLPKSYIYFILSALYQIRSAHVFWIPYLKFLLLPHLLFSEMDVAFCPIVCCLNACFVCIIFKLVTSVVETFLLNVTEPEKAFFRFTIHPFKNKRPHYYSHSCFPLCWSELVMSAHGSLIRHSTKISQMYLKTEQWETHVKRLCNTKRFTHCLCFVLCT